MMQQAIEDGGGHQRIAEHPVPHSPIERSEVISMLPRS